MLKSPSCTPKGAVTLPSSTVATNNVRCRNCGRGFAAFGQICGAALPRLLDT